MLYLACMLGFAALAQEPENAAMESRAKTLTGSIRLELVGPPTVAVGTVGRYVIVVRNAGTEAARDLEIEAQFPGGLDPLPGETDAAASGQHLRWSIPLLEAEAERRLTFGARGRAETTRGIEVRARLGVAAMLPTAVTRPRLEVRIEGPKVVEAGATFDCTAIITNSGSAAVANGGFEFQLSQGLKIVERPRTGRRSFQLEPEQSLSVPITLRAAHSGAQGVKARAKASAELVTEAEHKIHVQRPVLHVAVTGPQERLVGAESSYSLTVENQGDAPARDAVAFLELPKSFQFVAADSDGTFDPAQHLVYWTIGTLPAGEKRSMRATLMPRSGGAGELRGSIKERRSIYAETYWPIQVRGNAAAALELVPERDTVAVGERFRLRIRLRNTGTQAVTQPRLLVRVGKGASVVAEQSIAWARDGEEWRHAALSPLEVEQTTLVELHLEAKEVGGAAIDVRLASPDLAGTVAITQPIRVVPLEVVK